MLVKLIAPVTGSVTVVKGALIRFGRAQVWYRKTSVDASAFALAGTLRTVLQVVADAPVMAWQAAVLPPIRSRSRNEYALPWWHKC